MDNLDLTKNQISFDEYITLVIAESRKLGYVHPQVFYFDIEECYNEGCSVQICLDIVF